MPSRIEATRAKAALCATGRLTPLRLFSTLPVCSPKSGLMSAMGYYDSYSNFMLSNNSFST
jgi:hypothetical protein